MTDTTETATAEGKYVLLATVVYTYDNRRMPESLIEVHTPDCIRVTRDKTARIVREGYGDPIAAAKHVNRTVQQAFSDITSGGSLAAAMRERGEDPRFVTDTDGRTELWHFRRYVGRCVRGLDRRCFRPEWTDGADELGAGPY